MFAGRGRTEDWEMTKVKDCPHRMHENLSMRGIKEPDCWVNNCKIRKIPAPYSDVGTRVRCHLHGNCQLGKCDFYNEWSIQEVRDAFKKLDEIEAHRDAVLGVLRM
jgi:hypothetical protein